MLSKVVSKEEALTKIHDGQTIMFGDWHGEFAADEIIDGMLEKGIKNIHAIAVSAGMPDQGVGKLIREKRVKSLVTTHIALNPLARDQMFAGELDIEFCPQGTWSERIRCGGAGLGGFGRGLGLLQAVLDGREDGLGGDGGAGDAVDALNAVGGHDGLGELLDGLASDALGLGVVAHGDLGHLAVLDHDGHGHLAADALALAICHGHCATGVQLQKRIIKAGDTI